MKMIVELEKIMLHLHFAVLRHIAVNLLGQEKSKKLGIKNKQFLAAIDDSYLTRILNLSI